MRGHDALHGLPDAGEAEPGIEKGIHRDLIGRVQHGGQGPPHGAGMAGEVDRGKVVHTWCLEMQRANLGKIERLEVVGHAVRPGYRVLDGEAHVAVAELCDDAVVGKLDHAVHDALRVHDDLNLVHGHVEEPFGLDHFQPLVEKGGAVDGDLAAHGPGGVLQGLGHGDGGKLIGRQLAEGAAAGGEEDALNAAVAMAFQTLEDGVVLAVHGQDVHAFAFGGLSDSLAGHDEDFLAGHGQVHAALDGGQGRSQARSAHDGHQHHVGIGFIDEIHQPLRASMQHHIRRQQRARFFCGG